MNKKRTQDSYIPFFARAPQCAHDWLAWPAVGPALALLCGLLSASCDDESSAPDVVASDHGSFNLLTYNVAGLPQRLSGSDPEVNNALISPLLNDYDVVLVQEDFAYHEPLSAEAEHPYQTAPDPNQPVLGDGLNVFSAFPLGDVTRVQWRSCNGRLDAGSDCLTPKGFLVTELELAPGVRLDLYDMHADAGREPPDVSARADNLAQLAEVILERSQGRAVIVAGDFNERYSYGDQHLTELLAATGLSDVWVELEREGVLPSSPSEVAPECEEDEGDLSCERIDKFLYRSGQDVQLTPTDYGVDNLLFVDPSGVVLSDHPPVTARFEFRLEP